MFFLVTENYEERIWCSGGQCDYKNLKIKIYRTIILPFVLYGCETWSLTLREEMKLRVFENMVLRRVFGPRRDEVTGQWRRLHNEELNSQQCGRGLKFQTKQQIGEKQPNVPYILESNPHPFYSFRGLKNQMRIRIVCGLDSRSWAGFWKNDRTAVRAVRTIQYNNLLFYLLFIIYNIYNLLFIRLAFITHNWIAIRHPVTIICIFTIVLTNVRLRTAN